MQEVAVTYLKFKGSYCCHHEKNKNQLSLFSYSLILIRQMSCSNDIFFVVVVVTKYFYFILSEEIFSVLL